LRRLQALVGCVLPRQGDHFLSCISQQYNEVLGYSHIVGTYS
jgi:hypothetical protein